MHDAKKLNNCWEIRIEWVLELGCRAPTGRVGRELGAAVLAFLERD